MITKNCLFPCLYPMPEKEITIDVIPTKKIPQIAPKHEPLQLKVDRQAKKTIDETRPLTFREMMRTME